MSDENKPMSEADKLRAELAGLKAQSRATQNTLDAADELRTIRREIELEKKRIEFKATSPRVGLLTVKIPRVGDSLFRWPSDPTYAQFMNAALGKEDLDVTRCKMLVGACVLYPSAAQFEEECAANPAAFVSVANALLDVMKGKAVVEGKG